MSASFQTRITEIQDKLQKQYDDKEQVKAKNQVLREQLADLLNTYKKIENKYQGKLETKDVEIQ